MKQTLLAKKVITLKISFLFSSLILFLSTFLISCDNFQNQGVPNEEIFSAVAYSSDNGNSWNIQYVSGNSYSHSMNSILSLDFDLTLTSLTNYNLYRSEDIGLNWSEITPVFFKKKMIATGLMNSGIMIGVDGNISYTSDNGKTFSLIESGTHSNLNDISIDPKTGTGYIASYRKILETKDYGLTWHNPPADSSLINDLNLISINHLDSQKIYVTGHKTYSSEWNLIKSNDGLRTGIISDLPYYPDIGNYPDISSSISFFDENVGITVTAHNDGSIARTSDGGQTWSKMDISDEKKINMVKFINGICYATSKSKIHRSEDFGLTWTSDTLNDAYIFVDVYKQSNADLFMSGYIVKTDSEK